MGLEPMTLGTPVTVLPTELAGQLVMGLVLAVCHYTTVKFLLRAFKCQFLPGPQKRWNGVKWSIICIVTLAFIAFVYCSTLMMLSFTWSVENCTLNLRVRGSSPTGSDKLHCISAMMHLSIFFTIGTLSIQKSTNAYWYGHHAVPIKNMVTATQKPMTVPDQNYKFILDF